MSELKPCPFCGGEASLDTSNTNDISWSVDSASVECKACECKTDVQWNSDPMSNQLSDETINKAVDIWNARAQQSEWISVDDRLPQVGELVFVSTSGFVATVDIDNICNDGNWLRNSYSGDRTKSSVTHWIPLPTPPES